MDGHGRSCRASPILNVWCVVGMAAVVDNTTTKLDGALLSPLPDPSPAWDAGAEGEG